MLVYEENGRLLTYREYLPQFEKAADGLVRAEAIPETAGNQYPRDVALNALKLGNTVFALETAVSSTIRNGTKHFVPVKQGYTRCSCAAIRDDAVITADMGLASALEKNEIAVLRIRPGYIRLEGYDTGFIGGAGGRISEKEYVFFGDVTKHPDYKEMKAFADAHGVRLIPLSDEPLTDYGGLICTDQKRTPKDELRDSEK